MKLLVTGFMLVLAGCMTPLTPAFRERAAHMLVVTVEPPANEAGAEGSGILLGSDEESFYVLTAQHVVKDYAPDARLRIRSPLWPDREVIATRRIYDVSKQDYALPDRTVLVGPRKGLPEPFWRLLPHDTELKLHTQLRILGRQHGFIVEELVEGHSNVPAEAQVAGNHLESGSFTMASTIAPTGGDSGGAVFNRVWQLVGMYTGDTPDRAYVALPMDRLLEQVRGLEAGQTLPIKLEEMPFFTPTALAYVGVGIFVAGVVMGITARVQREHYYRDPTRDRDRVQKLNISADVLMSTGAAVDLYVASAFLWRWVTERRATRAWQP